MTQFAILLDGPEQRPSAVRLMVSDDSLALLGSAGAESRIPWWRLFRLPDEGTTHRFARLDKRDWELRVTSGADQELLSQVGRRPLARVLYPLRKIQFVKTAIGSVVLLAAIAQHFPPDWTAKMVPETLEHRLVDSVLAQNAARRCSHAGGEDAVRELLVRLDAQHGKTVNIFGFNDGEFLVTAAPPNTIVVSRGALQQTDPEAMAALLAHQLSHLRHGDAAIAMVRHEGTWGIWGALLEGRLPNGVRMDYSGLEERRADLEAMGMLRRARISMEPAARLFEDIRVSRAQGTFLAFEYRDFHFGIDSAAKRWAAAASSQLVNDRTEPALRRDTSDALFNFCWAGRLPPVTQISNGPPQFLPRYPGSPGMGGVPAARDQQ